ncbi:MAG: beta-CASP ribonuclease aCPSF1 [Euryarchaeota archaeon]|nr:beta-CASP ribonuclease aCPSF1 [Euryarchaeota archaeon]
MAQRLTLQEVKRTISEMIPDGIPYEVELEAATIAIVTHQPTAFSGKDSLASSIAKAIRRRIAIRPHDDLLLDEAEAKTVIQDTVPESAGIETIHFDRALREVLILCKQPGDAVGPRGSIRTEIASRIGWLVRIERVAPLPCRTVSDVRRYLAEHADERKTLLNRFGRQIYRAPLPGKPWGRVTALGSYGEVGRACHLLTTNESRVLIDVGVNIASDTDPMPYFNAPEALPIDTIDAVVLTHAHLDHAGMLPVLFKYGFDGPVFCTPPTRDLMTLLQGDYIKVSGLEGKAPPYSMEHVRKAVLNTVLVDWNVTTDVAPDLKLTFHNAGHILGSSSCHFHIGEGAHNIVFSGDSKYEKSWLFDAADVRYPRAETLVLESTYGSPGDFQPSRLEATQELQDTVTRTIERGGKLMLPVFAVGRSQEVMIAIDELFRSGDFPPVPVWLDGMILEATAIHASHPHYLTGALKRAILTEDGSNPFTSDWFKTVDGWEQRESILMDSSPCIVLATSGMLSGGPIMDYIRAWAPEPRNSLCFVGYQAEGTLGRRMQKGFGEVPIRSEGQTIRVPVKAEVLTIDGFSGHSDRRQLIEFVEKMSPQPRTIICHHGDIKKCNELGQSLKAKFKVRTHAPRNLETVRLF